MERLSWAKLNLAVSLLSAGFVHLSIHSAYIWDFFNFNFYFLLGTLPASGNAAGKGMEREGGYGDLSETDRAEWKQRPESISHTEWKVQIWKHKLHLCLEGECSTPKPKVRLPLMYLRKKQIWLPWHEEVKARSSKLGPGGPHRSEREFWVHFEI